MRLLIAILILVCLALSGSLYYRHTKAVKQEEVDTEKISDLSTEVTTTKKEIEEQKKVNTVLETDLANRTEELAKTSNMLANASATIVKVQEEAKLAAANAAAD